MNSCVRVCFRAVCTLVSSAIAMGEPTRCISYSEDLRWKIVWQHKTHERKARDIAHCLFVAPSTVSCTVDCFDRTGSVARSSATSLDHILHEHNEFLLVT